MAPFQNGLGEVLVHYIRKVPYDSIAQPYSSWEKPPWPITSAFHFNGGLFVQNKELGARSELSSLLDVQSATERESQHDWSPTYEVGRLLSSSRVDALHQIIQQTVVNTPSSDPKSPDTAKSYSFDLGIHHCYGVQAVPEEPSELYILDQDVSVLAQDLKGQFKASALYSSHGLTDLMATEFGTVACSRDGKWFDLVTNLLIEPEQVASRWVRSKFEMFGESMLWEVRERPDGRVEYRSPIGSDPVKFNPVEFDLSPEWPWDRLIACGSDEHPYPFWLSTQTHLLRRESTVPEPAVSVARPTSLSQSFVREKISDARGVRHVPVEVTLAHPPSIPKKTLPVATRLSDIESGIIFAEGKLKIQNLDTGESNFALSNAGDFIFPLEGELCQGDLWFVDEEFKLKWIPVEDDWLHLLHPMSTGQ